MKEYTLFVSAVVSTTRTYEAESLEDAIEAFYGEGMPSVMFVDHTYPDVGEWEVDEEAAREEYPDE